ncbi:MAG TPA: hypothetical protein VH420_10280 [Gaiellaceae bacterium]|jgi:hypothetical protein
MKLTRKELIVGGAAGAALGAAGIYELVDRLADSPSHFGEGREPEQHLLDGMRIEESEGVEIVIPTRHHQMVTAKVQGSPGSLRDAQAALAEVLQKLDDAYPGTPDGLAITVAWGLPYFRDHVPASARKHLPFDRRAEKSALLDAMRFPSDPHETLLEDNDAAFLFRSDHQDHIQKAATEIFDRMKGVLAITSIRKGFAGQLDGGPGLPKEMATAAGVPGAELIPDGSELFLGFTSTQRHALGPPRIVNFETLGLVDLGPRSYFHGGTHMHLSHVFEDLEAWYLNFDFRERVNTTFKPRMPVKEGTQTVPQPPERAASTSEVERDFDRFGAIGHSSSLQPASRLQHDVRGSDGTLYTKGTAIPQRADFNTLDNPFFWSATPERDRMADGPAAGLHFVVFNPSSDDFHRNRLAMDGVMPGGAKLPFGPRDRGQGFNSILQTTHRQNFLVPPRRHRAFPLAEL